MVLAMVPGQQVVVAAVAVVQAQVGREGWP